MRSRLPRLDAALAVVVTVALAALNLAFAPFASAAVPGGPFVAFSTATASVIEDAGTIDFTVTLDVAVPDSDVIVTATSSDVTAVEDDDYAGFSIDVVIPAGETSADVTVTIVDDDEGSLAEAPSESFIVTLTEPRLPSGAPSTVALGSPTILTIGIEDDDIVARDDSWDPTGADLTLITNMDQDLSVDAGDGLLANDDDRLDADPGDTANVVDSSTVPFPSGVALTNDDGSFDYDPATGFTGEVSFDYTVTDGSAAETATVKLRVNGPVTAGDDEYAVSEDATLDTSEELASVLADDTDGEDATPFSDTLYVDSHTDPAHGTLTMATGPGSDGHFEYTPAVDYNGPDSFTYVVADGFGGTDTGAVSITVTEVNDAPSFTLSDQIVTEDAEPLAQTVAEGDWLTAIDDGDPTASIADDQSVSFAITDNDNAELFAAVPALTDTEAGWILSYTPVADANGVATVEVTATDDGTTGSGADAQETADTFTITVGAVNDAPEVTPVDQTIDEDAGAITIGTRGWTSVLNGGDPELEESFSYALGTVEQDADNPVVFAANPAISEAGEITFTVADDDHGAFTLPVTVTDDNATPEVADDMSTAVDVIVTVDAINDQPVVVTVDQTIDEDPETAAQSVAVGAWTSTLDDGDPTTDPADVQSLSYTLDSLTPGANPLTFAEGGAPAIDETTGELTYTPAADDSGSVTLTVTITDDGGTTNEGDDDTVTVTLAITVGAVNDAPTFTLADQTVDEDAGAQSVAEGDWLTDIDDGDPFANPEDTQSVTFAVTGNTNPGLFASGPAVTAGASESIPCVVTTHGDCHYPAEPGPWDYFCADLGAGLAQCYDTVTGIFPFSGCDMSVPGETCLIEIGEGDGNVLVYTPAENANGSATVTITATDDNATPEDETDDLTTSIDFTITVDAVNDAPTFTVADQTVDEDAGAQSVTEGDWLTDIDDGDPTDTDADDQTVSFVVTSTNPTLFATAPNVTGTEAGWVLSYTPADDANGTAIVTVTGTDDGGTTNEGDDETEHTLKITVGAVNDAPTFTLADQTIDEDAGAQSVAEGAWLTDIDDGDPFTSPDDAQNVDFAVTAVSNETLFSAGPTVTEGEGGWTLSYTPAGNANGSATITITATDDNATPQDDTDDLTTSIDFTITVDAVNDAPAFTLADQAVAEDAGAQTVAQGAWLTDIDDGDPTGTDADNQTVAFEVTDNDNTALFAAAPTVTSTEAGWVLSYTPADDANGAAIVTVTGTDDGGTTNEGDDETEHTLRITVGAVNDEPTATAVDQSIDEDAGAQTVAVGDWTSGLDEGGGPDENTQSLSFSLDSVTNGENPLTFAEGGAPAIDETTGELTYTPAADDNGSVTLSVTITDDGGTENEGDDNSLTITVDITVDPINDEPTATGVAQTIDEDADPQTVAVDDWTSGLDEGGGPDEDSQTLGYTFVSASNTELLSAGPAVDATTGALTYTPAANANGTSTLTVTITDDGGTANEGDDDSVTITVDITVDPINDAPNVTPVDQTIDEDADAQSIGVGTWTSTLDDGDPEADQTLSYGLTLVTQDPTNGLTFTTAPAVDRETGTLTFDVDPEQNGSATVSIAVTDDGPTANEDDDNDTTVDVVITVTPVNDTPDFAAIDQTVLEDAGEQTVALGSWATDITDGDTDADDTGLDVQALSYEVTDNDNPGLFAADPSIDSEGVLTYTTAPDANSVLDGTAEIEVTQTDDGGTPEDGTDDESVTDTFTISVTAVDDAEDAVDDEYILDVDTDASDEDDVNLSVDAEDGVLANDLDADVDADSLRVMSFTVPTSGEVGVLADGSFDYDADPDFIGTSTFEYTMTDDVDGGSSTATVTLKVNGPPNRADADAIEYVTDEDKALAIGFEELTARFGDVADTVDDVVSFASADQPGEGQGEVAVNEESGTVTYTPAEGFIGTATFTIAVTDDRLETTETVTVRVNAAPDTTDDDATVLEDGSVSIDPADLIADDTDSDDAITDDVVAFVGIDKNPLHGSLTLEGTGTYTYEPDPDFAGSDTFTYEVTDGRLNAFAAVEVTVTPVNDAPEFTLPGDPDQIVEDAEAVTVAGFYTGEDAGGGDDEDETQTLSLDVSSTNPGLFADGATPAIDRRSGELTYETAADANGTSIVTVTLTDDGGVENDGLDTTVATFTILVTEVNDAPVFSLAEPADQTVLEDAGPQSVDGFYGDAGPGGGPDELDQTLALSVTTTNADLFAVAPAIDDATGELTYTPADDANGTATVTVTVTDDGTTNGSADPLATAVDFTITVTPVNDAPGFGVADQGVLEDAGPVSVIALAWLTSVDDGDPTTSPADVQSVDFAVTDVSDPALFAAGPAIDETGALTFTPADDANGTATVEITATDDGGTDNEGDNDTTETLTITITPVNDAPTIALGDQSVLEDSGPAVIAGSEWLTTLDDGDPMATTADDQATDVTITDVSDPALFAAGPAIDEAGALTFTPADDANGTATVEITATDDGGTDNEGDNDTTETLTITITPVNDKPSFLGGADIVTDENTGLNEYTPWATSISVGPANETEGFSFEVSNDSPDLFLVEPSIDGAGALRFTLAVNEHGVAELTVVMVDEGGTDGDGEDTSEAVTFTITVNDLPVAVDDEYITDEGDDLFTDGEDGVLANDLDADSDLSVASHTEPSSGDLILDLADGSFAYTPDDGFTGTDTFTYVVTDGRVTDEGTVTIVVNGAPTAVDDDYEVDEDETLVISAEDSVLANDTDDVDDVDDEVSAVAATVLSARGVVVTIAPDGTFSYTPPADFNGTDSFAYTAADDRGLSDSATVTIAVAPVNDRPTAVDDEYDVDEDTTLVIAAPGLALNDTDTADGADDDTTVVAETVATSEGGVVEIGADGSIIYTPPSDFFGTDTFTYSATDEGGLTDKGTVVIDVANVNDTPVAVDDQYLAEQDTPLVVSGDSTLLLKGVDDADADEDALEVVAGTVITTEGVSVELAANGSFSYTPPAGFLGTDTFEYVITDGVETSTPATVTIVVEPPAATVSIVGGDSCNPVSPLVFGDTPGGSFYYSAVQWAVACEITLGLTPSSFGPDVTVNRAQFITFLWRAAGRPAPAGGENFDDVSPGQFFYDAVRWAVNADGPVTLGLTPTMFGPDVSIDRAQAVTLLHRFFGLPTPGGGENFDDVSPGQYFYDAVRWAVNAENPITLGMTPTTFGPSLTATRSQALTFLYRASV